MPTAASYVEIRYRRTDSIGQWTFVKIPAGQDTVQLSGVERGVSYQIEARSVALSGSASDWVAQTHIVSALTLAPLTPTSLAATSLADGVHLTWLSPDVQRADVEYEIQRTGDIAGAPDGAHWATLNMVRSLRYTDGVTDGIVRWYRVRASTYGGITTAFTSNINSRGKTVADGATVGATIGPGGNVTGAVDANGRAIVDFTQSHLNKNQDNVGDGTTFKRLANVNADNTLHVSTSLNVQGSLLPNQVVLISFAMPEATVLNATWLAQSPGRPDSSVLSVPASSSVLGANLVTDGDGESATVGSQAAGWTFDSGNGLLGANDFAHSGSKSLKIINPTAVRSFSHQDLSVNVINGRVYSLQGWIKTTVIPTVSGSGALLNVDAVSGVTGFTIISKTGTDFLSTEPDVGLPADNTARDWTFVQCLFKPTGSGVLRIYCQLGYSTGCSGSAWFDDVGIFPTGASWSGLTPSQGYYLYSYIDAITGNIVFANGSPPPTSPSDTIAAQCSLDQRYPLPVKHIVMPSSGGTGSDTGGGSGTCPEFDALVTVRRYSYDGELLFEGDIKAGEVRRGYESDDGRIKRGDFLKGYSFKHQMDVYRAVHHYQHVPCSGWMRIDGIRFTACEMMYDAGAWVAAWKIPGAAHDGSVGIKVLIQVEADWDDEHNYYVIVIVADGNGVRLIHNGPVLPC
ncbi:MAG: hypothetical protein ACRD72_09020 [Candidatus Angelobacter sp.]